MVTSVKCTTFAPSNEIAFGGILFTNSYLKDYEEKNPILTLATLLLLPTVLLAEETEIQLTAVIAMGVIPGDNPLDDCEPVGENPTRPTCFRATINSNLLTVLKQDATIPFAQATVVKASTGSMVLNQQFTNSLSEQIATPGVYVLRISTAGGDLVGQFVVQ